MVLEQNLTIYTLPKKYQIKIMSESDNFYKSNIIIEFNIYDPLKVKQIFADFFTIPFQILKSMNKLIHRKVYNKKLSISKYEKTDMWVTEDNVYYIFEIIDGFDMTFIMNVEEFEKMYDDIIKVSLDISKRKVIRKNDIVQFKVPERSYTYTKFDLIFMAYEYKNSSYNFPHYYIWKRLNYNQNFVSLDNSQKFIMWYKYIKDKSLSNPQWSYNYISVDIPMILSTKNNPDYDMLELNKYVLDSVPYRIYKISNAYINHILDNLKQDVYSDTLEKIYQDNVSNYDIIGFYIRNFQMNVNHRISTNVLTKEQIATYLFMEFEQFISNYELVGFKTKGLLRSTAKEEFPLHYLIACDILTGESD